MPQKFPSDGTIFAALGSKKLLFDVVGGSCLRIFDAGPICIELAKVGCHLEYLSLAILSLQKGVQNSAPAGLVVADALLAEAKANKAIFHSRATLKWEQNLYMPWASWPCSLILNVSS
jgi:hypothetical protein